MVQWPFSTEESRQRARDEMSSLLPTQQQEIPSAYPPEEVTKVALRLKHQIETVVPCELEEAAITKAHSQIITDKVVKTAKEAGGEKYKACTVYCLLICKKWFSRQASLELWDADLHDVRAVACEVIAKRIIEGEPDQDYLLEQLLLKRFATVIDGEDTASANAIEKAVDLHALRVIGSSGYQKCISYLWRGWLIQDDNSPAHFVAYKEKTNTSYWAHLVPDRMRVPKYQNILQITFTLLYLGLYTIAINTINPTGDLDVIEGLLYLFTVGFICDEVAKFWKVGRYYISFWNIFNNTLYTLLAVSFITRMIALGHPLDAHARRRYNVLSYNFLAFTAPMFWMRILLYLDTFRFFGAMLVVVKVMMKESLIFFALLFIVLVGFLQAFLGLDQADDNSVDATGFILQAMVNAIMTSPDFDGFERFGHPFGLILYYIYTFVTMVVLLNVLVALYNSAYSDITDAAIDEYMALFSQKCLQFVRAPDENVFIPPLNLVEIFFLILPFEWWLSKPRYERLNNVVMGVLYSPLLVVTAALEQRGAKAVRENRRRGEADEDTTEEWEGLGRGPSGGGEEWKVEVDDQRWCGLVKETSPNVEVDATMAEVVGLRREVGELKELVRALVERGGIGGSRRGEEDGGVGERGRENGGGEAK